MDLSRALDISAAGMAAQTGTAARDRRESRQPGHHRQHARRRARISARPSPSPTAWTARWASPTVQMARVGRDASAFPQRYDPGAPGGGRARLRAARPTSTASSK